MVWVVLFGGFAYWVTGGEAFPTAIFALFGGLVWSMRHLFRSSRTPKAQSSIADLLF